MGVVDGAMVLFHDAEDGGEPETRAFAFRLGGEEGLEGVIQGGGIHAATFRSGGEGQVDVLADQPVHHLLVFRDQLVQVELLRGNWLIPREGQELAGQVTGSLTCLLDFEQPPLKDRP